MLTVQNIEEMDSIISQLGVAADDDARNKVLVECVEDPDLFVTVMRKYKNVKHGKQADSGSVKAHTDSGLHAESSKYSKDLVLDEFMHTDAAQLKKKYSLKELTLIFEAVYSCCPLSGTTKEQLVSSVKELGFTIARSKAFGEAAKQRAMKCGDSKAAQCV